MFDQNLLHHISDLLTKTGNSTCEPVNTSIVINHGLAFYPDHIPTTNKRY